MDVQRPPLFFVHSVIQLINQTESEKKAEELYLTVFAANFPLFQHFVFAFIPDMDILCLPVPAFHLVLLGYITG